MVDRRSADLAACRRVVEAKRAVAEMAHARALRAEVIAADRERHAIGECGVALTQWQDHLTGSFDPALGSLLGSVLVTTAATADAAATAHRDARETRRAAARQWREDDMRCTQSRLLADDHARRVVQAREERQLSGLADRITFAWSRR